MREPALLDTVQAFVNDKGLFAAPCRILVGVSGGADSLTLLHLLTQWPGVTVEAAHVHHGLRGEEADRDAALTERLCREWRVPFHLLTRDVPGLSRAWKCGVEEAARRARYEALEECRAAVGADFVAVAHTADDNAETVLFHIARGCGIGGLTGIPARRDRVIRPLLTVSRAEIEAYAASQGIPYVTDSTNADRRYSRNRVRHELMPLMRSLNPAADRAILRLAAHAAETEDCLDGLAVRLLTEAGTPAGGLTVSSLAAVHPAIRRRALIRWLGEQDCYSYDESHIVALEKLVLAGRGETCLRGSTVAVCDGVLCRAPGQGDAVPEQAVTDLPYTVIIGGHRHELRRLDRAALDALQIVHKMFFKYAVNYATIQGGLMIRGRRDGDRFHPAGRGCGKSLKKLLYESGIPESRRDGYPLLCDDAGIVLIPGLGCDERVRPDGNTNDFLVWFTDGEPCYSEKLMGIPQEGENDGTEKE